MPTPSRFALLVEEAKSRIVETTPEEVEARRAAGEAPIVLDVREEEEYRKDHAAGALHISKGVLEREVEKRIPDSDAPIVVYCAGGSRSALAADALRRMGYTNVASMKGGMRRWRELEFPEEAGAVAREDSRA